MKTKILATIGPASNKRDVLSKLIVAGVRIFRLNFSHGDSSSFVDLIKTIRELEVLHKTPITILQDLSGPKIRIGTIGGNGTLIGASANVVLSGISAKHGHPITFGHYLKVGFPTMVLSVAISTVYLLVRFH